MELDFFALKYSMKSLVKLCSSFVMSLFFININISTEDIFCQQSLFL